MPPTDECDDLRRKLAHADAVVAEPMAEVVLRSGAVVRVPLGAAPESITRLVAAVGAASC